MSRWKYKQELVTVGENSQTVRQLTAEQRGEVMDTRAKLNITGGKLDTKDAGAGAALQRRIVHMAAINPELSEQDVAEMPADLLDACSAKVMDLTNGPAADDEKKAD